MIIYAIKIEEKIVADVLNYVKFICNPSSKTEAHLSVRGPYAGKIKPERFKKYNSIIKGAKIEIKEAGNFFGDNQLTVFLKCISPKIAEVWYKPHYGYIPHITLYDGSDSGFAHQLYERLGRINIDLSFTASELIEYNTKKSMLSFDLSFGYDTSVLNKIGVPVHIDDLVELSINDKLDIISKCFDVLVNLNR
jgi:hypothetical protein